MNWDKVKENWSSACQKAKNKWTKLSDNDLDQIDGNRTSLMEKLVEYYPLSLEEAGFEVDKWAEYVEDHY